MKRDEASKLLKRFLSAQQEGKEPYFDADEIDRLLDSLEEADDWNHYGDIIRLGMKLHPGHQDLKLRECKLYIFREKYQKALDLLDEVSDVLSQDMDMLRLECYCHLDKYKKALHYIQSQVDSQSEHAEILFEYTAGVLNDLDMNEEARDLINRGLKLYPDNLILKDELCYLLEAKGEFTEAIRLCNELIDKDPFSYDTWFMLGRLYSMTGEFEKAVEAFDYALACDESDMELKILKSYCLFMNENYEKAIEAYQEIATDEESQERIKPLIAECYIKLERFEECYEILKKIIEDPGEDPESTSYINYIRCCLETGREEEGRRILHKAVQLFPGDVRVLSLLALNYIENGKEEQALEVTHRIFNQIEQEQQEETIEKNEFFHNSLNLYFKGDLNKAFKYYKKVFDFKPNMPFMHIQRAMAYFNIGDMELFDKYYRKASALELSEYIRLTRLDCNERFSRARHIPPEDLTFEYLYNKDNNN
ncbi:MAG: tetratricopeptide repeat protein [Tannerellaceae bacterium]|nr:tetratricopeptide repeat protein [Tannerellaceae bacterium]